MTRFVIFSAIVLLSSKMAFAESVRFNYTAEVATNSASDDVVFGEVVPRLTSVTGFFEYSTDVLDSNPSQERGEYQQIASNFFASIDIGDDSFSITGSSEAFVQVENFDSSETLRYRDGDQLFLDTGLLSVNGVESSTASLLFAASGNPGLFADDSLPLSPAVFISSVGGPSDFLPHTFSLNDGDSSLLLQFTSVSAVPEPGVAIPFLLGALAFTWRKRHSLV